MTSTFESSDADAYEALTGRWRTKLTAPFLEFADPADGESVLDAGCRTGGLTRAIAQAARVRSVTGIDATEANVAFAEASSADPRIS